MSDPARILLIKPSSLGDIVHALPVLAALRARYPQARIAWLVGSAFAPLLEGHPLLDEVIRFDRKRYGRMWFDPRAALAFARFVAELRARRFDLVVDLQGLIRSGLISWFSGARTRIGFAHAREGAWLFYTRRVRVDAARVHAVDCNLAVARELGLEAGRAQFPLALTDAELDAARALVGGPRPFTAVLPGARWASKLWPAESFAALIDALQAAGQRCVLLGAADERSRAEQIGRGCAVAPLDLTGRTSLRELAAVLALAERVVCCDSGPMHIAAALDRPSAALFGPTNPERTGPYSAAAQVVRLGLSCAPCYRRVCPLGHQACLRELGVERVAGVVRELRVVGSPGAGATASPRSI